MTENFELTSGKNRALVCYCNADNEEAFFNAIKTVFDNQQIEIDNASDAFSFYIDEPKTALNIALSWNETSRRLRFGGSFSDVCVGVFFYNQPAPPPQPADSDEEPDEPLDAGKWREYMSTYKSINQDEEPEPRPAPSITSLVCDALREYFGGIFGASSFVIPNDVTSFALEVE